MRRYRRRARPLNLPMPYQLVAAFLTPFKTDDELNRLQRLCRSPDIGWEQLVFAANTHLCAPLWYVQLANDGLLPLVPIELQRYLQELYRMNTDRNQSLKQILTDLLNQFNASGIDAIFLKGAACLCDGLYHGDPGARMLPDADLLVRLKHLDAAEALMKGMGFVRTAETESGKATNPARRLRGHHLPRYMLPGTPASIEIHFKVCSGQAGAVLNPEKCWNNRHPTVLAGESAFLLNPTDRMLHNALHTLIQDRGYIRSMVPLYHLAEFVFLSHTYGNGIDWKRWNRTAERHHLQHPLNAYIEIAHHLMNMPYPQHFRSTKRSRFDTARIIHGGNHPLRHLNPKTPPSRRAVGSRIGLMLNCFYYTGLPGWAWQHVTQVLDGASAGKRLIYIAKKISNPRLRNIYRF